MLSTVGGGTVDRFSEICILVFQIRLYEMRSEHCPPLSWSKPVWFLWTAFVRLCKIGVFYLEVQTIFLTFSPMSTMKLQRRRIDSCAPLVRDADATFDNKFAPRPPIDGL